MLRNSTFGKFTLIYPRTTCRVLVTNGLGNLGQKVIHDVLTVGQVLFYLFNIQLFHVALVSRHNFLSDIDLLNVSLSKLIMSEIR